jgi:hypothetical protein
VPKNTDLPKEQALVLKGRQPKDIVKRLFQGLIACRNFIYVQQG